MTKPQLKYFDCFGRAGSIKLLFKLANFDYEDVIVPFQNWDEEKTSLGLPLEQLPVLEIDGVTLCQTKAIERFAATKAGLIGKCALAEAKSDMMIETVSDVQMKCWMGCFGALAAEFPTIPGTARLIESTEENRTKRAAAFSENFKKIFGEACAPLDKILSLIQTNENFCVGEELTLADIHLVKLYVFSKDSILGNDFEKNCPKTFKTAEKIINKNSQIKEFVEAFLASGKPCTGIGVMY